MSSVSLASRAGAALRPLRRWPGWRLWPWLPLAFAAVYGVLLLTSFKSLVQGLYLSSDTVTAPYIAELFHQRAGGEVVLGNFPWYDALWLERLTNGLPAHRQIWQVMPWLLSIGGIGLVAWAAARAAGRWAAMLVAVGLGCASTALLTFQFSWSGHSLTFVHLCVLAAVFVLWADRGGVVGNPPAHVALCALVAGVTAAGVASDQLLALAGIAPLLVAGLAMPWLIERRAGILVAASSVAVSVVSLAGAWAITKAMRADHLVAADFPISYATFDRVGPNVSVLAHGLAYLFNGDFSGARVTAKSTLAFACAAVLLVGIIAVYRYLRRWWAGRLTGTAEPPARIAYVAFWAVAGVVPMVAFVVSSLPVDQTTGRYVIPTGYAVVALLPLATLGRGALARAAAVAGVCLVVTGSIAALVRRDIQDNPNAFPTGDVSGPLLRFAQRQNLQVGYSGYWDAAPLTWQTKAKLQVYPVKPCSADLARPCIFPYHRITNWYRARPNTRTFLVIDPARPQVSPIDPGDRLGRPARVAQVGRLKVYIYDYDIAARFGPPER